MRGTRTDRQTERVAPSKGQGAIVFRGIGVENPREGRRFDTRHRRKREAIVLVNREFIGHGLTTNVPYETLVFPAIRCVVSLECLSDLLR